MSVEVAATPTLAEDVATDSVASEKSSPSSLSSPSTSTTEDRDNVVERATQLLADLFEVAGVDDTHGIFHAKKVLGNLDGALHAASKPIADSRQLACRLAALLHDADDKKYFPETAKTYGNAVQIATKAGAAPAVIADMLRMISWVSCSKNGNSCPEEATKEPELLWPRWADRLEAVGEMGVARCYLYNVHKGDPLSSESSPRPANEEEVFRFATPERFAEYQTSGGNSNSMIDHYYDKLLSVARPPPEIVQNSFLEAAALQSAAPLVKVCLQFAETGEVPVAEIEAMAVRQGLQLPANSS